MGSPEPVQWLTSNSRSYLVSGPNDEDFDRGYAAWESLRRGDIEPTRAFCSTVEPDPVVHAWTLALRAGWHHAETQATTAPTLDEIAIVPTESRWVRGALGLACVQLARGAVLRFDRTALTAILQLHHGLLEGGELAESHLGYRAGLCWISMCDGAYEQCREAAVELEHEASEAGVASLVVEAASLRALAAAAVDDLEDAVATARRASRMARTEALPQAEYLANLVLARIRRIAGRPHLTGRIVDALLKVAPPAWHGWMAWELVLAGGLSRARSLCADGSGPATPRALVEIIDAARGGSTATLDDTVRRTRQQVGGWQPQSRDLEVAIAAIDPRFEREETREALSPWRHGDASSPPAEVRGLATLASAEEETSVTAWVVAQPGRRAKRMLAVGRALVSVDRVLLPKKGYPGRGETLVSALALAGDSGLSRPDAFRTIYGFEYSPPVHAGLFKVLLHRTRAQLEEVGDIDLNDDILQLRLTGSVLVPDPRCEQPLEERVLRVLARRGHQSAKDAAAALDVPLRTVQKALKVLVAEGAISMDRKGRGIAYRVEDTTFMEPTQTGLTAS